MISNEFNQDIGKLNAYTIKQMKGLATFGQMYENIEYHLFNAYGQENPQKVPEE
jgi:hypothetical protein